MTDTEPAMYCKDCYTRLEASWRFCTRCGKPFDPRRERSYLKRPFPPAWRIAWQVIVTAIVALIVASIISFFQLSGASGH